MRADHEAIRHATLQNVFVYLAQSIAKTPLYLFDSAVEKIV
jgi:hypothetical protein